MTSVSLIREHTSLEHVCSQVQVRAGALVDKVLDGPRWKMQALLLVLALSLLRAFPSYDALGTDFVKQKWRDAQIKVDEPMADMGQRFPPETHESKLTFRLTVPLLARVLHLRMAGGLVLSALIGVLLLFLVLHVTHEITNSRKAAWLLCLAASCGWAGEAAFHELRGGYYDAAALCLLLLAICSSGPLTVALLTCAAAWTDERALAASSFVLLFHAVHRPNGVRTAFGVCLGIGAYVASRMYMTETGHYAVSLAGTGWTLAARQMNVLPLALWSGLSGCWIPVVSGIAALIMHRRFGLLFVFATALGGFGVSAFCVVDTTRSTAYLFPAMFTGLAILRQSESTAWMERIAWATGILSLFVPPFYIEGGTGVWWLYPLPVQIARWLTTFLPAFQ